jgi:toxin-antitoxin system PIN domain toxin
VIVVDTNLLLYAVDASSPRHALARQWLDATMQGDEPVGFAWAALLGFVRISTNPRIFEHCLPLEQALGIVSLWLQQPVATVVEPGERHWEILQTLVRDAGRGGALVTDAHLAALCIERGATLASADGDFTRFRGLRFLNPLV